MLSVKKTVLNQLLPTTNQSQFSVFNSTYRSFSSSSSRSRTEESSSFNYPSRNQLVLPLHSIRTHSLPPEYECSLTFRYSYMMVKCSFLLHSLSIFSLVNVALPCVATSGGTVTTTVAPTTTSTTATTGDLNDVDLGVICLIALFE